MEARLSGAAEILARARGYPYAAPGHSYCYRDGAVAAFDPAGRAGRTPVLACGSNRAPARLWDKFGADGEIPVECAVLAGHDVVFSAHISRYGAVPATIHGAPGCRVSLAVTWLDDAQLEIMHESEVGASNYRVVALDGALVSLDSGDTLDEVLAYASRRGHFLHDGGAVALDAFSAEGRRLPQMTGAQVLDEVRRRFAGDSHSDDFILRLVDDADYRRSCTAYLEANAGQLFLSNAHQSRQASKS